MSEMRFVVDEGCDDENRRIALGVAERLGLEAESLEHGKKIDCLALRFDNEGLALADADGLCVRGDFEKMLPRLKQNNLGAELIVKAAKSKDNDHPLTAVDATAGLGEDSLLLAAAGYTVEMFEYNPIVAELLKDAIRRAKKIDALAQIVGRMNLTRCDSVVALPKIDFAPYLVVLDPMFPSRQKSALVKKKFQLIHKLESPCNNENELLNAAIAANPRKIIVKRPSKALCLAGVKPNYAIEGKGIRYDCIVLPTHK